MTELVGQDMGRYHIIEKIGQGGMATVYKAFDTRLERDVAVKVIRKEVFSSEILDEVLQRFEREAKALAKFSHPNILKIHDFGEYEGSPYLILEYLPGGTLKRYLDQPVPWQEAIRLLLPVARGLSYAHRHGVLHRDVKPSNVLITETGEPMLTDFGIAKLLEAGEGHTLTGSGVGIGTPEYMAPEQGLGQGVDARADIYSLGIVLYEMVTGRKPYMADTPMAVVLKQMTDPLPRPREYIPDLPLEVENILFKALAKKPEDRYENMDAFIAALESLPAGQPASEPRSMTFLTPAQPTDIPQNPPAEAKKPAPAKPVSPTRPTTTFVTQPVVGQPLWKKFWLLGLVLFGFAGLAGLLIVGYFVLSNIPGLQLFSSAPTGDKPAANGPTSKPAQTVLPDNQLPVLRINMEFYPDLLDPQKSSVTGDIAHLKLIYEGLTTYDTTLATVPGAAEKWTYNSDATVLTFTLRKNLKYSDGSLLNAERFAYSIKRNINPVTGGEYVMITEDIKGAREWSGGDASARAIVDRSVKASHANGDACTGYADEACNTLTLTFSKPAPYFHTIMGIWVAYPAKQELIEAGGKDWWKVAKNHVGNGPFALKNLEEGSRAFFVPNRNYWRGVGQLTIEYKYIDDPAAAFEAYKKNELDIIPSSSEKLAAITADSALRAEHMVYSGSCTIAIMFHQQKKPFNDKKVREAFAYALDREAWAKDLEGGLVLPTLTWIPKGYPGYKSGETRWRFDPEKARQALAQSSYGSVKNLPKITLTFPDTDYDRARFEWLQAQWKKVFGSSLKISLNPVDTDTYNDLSSNVATAPLVSRLGWCSDYPDPQNWLSAYWETGKFGGAIGYSNPKFDTLVNQADAELNPTKRADLYQQAQDVLIESVPAAFLYNSISHYLVKPWVKGIKTTSQDAGWPGEMDPLNITIDTSMKP